MVMLLGACICKRALNVYDEGVVLTDTLEHELPSLSRHLSFDLIQAAQQHHLLAINETSFAYNHNFMIVRFSLKTGF